MQIKSLLEEEVESLIASIASADHRLSLCTVGEKVFEDVILIFNQPTVVSRSIEQDSVGEQITDADGAAGFCVLLSSKRFNISKQV